MKYTPSIETLINELRKLPGVGPKSAQRMVYHILKQEDRDIQALSDALSGVIGKIKNCERCFNLAEENLCPVCTDQGRDQSVLCVVEQPFDILSFEKIGIYRGLYHCLLGALSPMDGITPDHLKIASLLERVKKESIREVIIATNPDTEGEATSGYLIRLLKPLEITVSRLGVGIPIGGDLEYTDQVTLTKAFEGRRIL